MVVVVVGVGGVFLVVVVVAVGCYLYYDVHTTVVYLVFLLLM